MISILRRLLASLVVVGALGAFVWAIVDDSPDIEPAATASGDRSDRDAAEAATTPAPIAVLGRVPALVEIDQWLNTDATTLDAARGDVTIVQFWTFGCFNCKNTLPHLQALYTEHHDAGLEIIGVHAPEFSYEADPTRVTEAVIELGVTWPVALDTQKKNFRSWQPGTTNYWPRTYVVDQDGRIRFDHIGEGAYDELGDVVTRLLTEGPSAT